MPILSGQTLTVMQLRDAQRKLEITPIPTGGATGDVLSKLSPADGDIGWQAILGGLVAAGNGIVFAGNTVHFAQAAAYTTNAIPFASGAATIGFDPTRFIWDAAAGFLGVGVNTQTAYSERLYAYDSYADITDRVMLHAITETSVPGGFKFCLGVGIATTGVANFNVGTVTAGIFDATHGGSGTYTSNFVGLSVLHGKNTSGTGAVTQSVGLSVQTNNLNAIGAIGTSYDIFIISPLGPGAVTTNYAIYQQSSTAFNYFAGNTSLGVAAFSASVLLRGQRTYAVSGANVFGASFDITNNPAGAQANVNYGGFFQMQSAGAQNFTFGTAGIAGVIGSAWHGGTGTATQGCGGYFYVTKASTGPMTTALGVRIQVLNSNATNAIVTGYGAFLDTPSVIGAITTYYGLYLSAGAGTTVYGIAQVGTSDLNYLAGFSAFGSNAPVNTTFALFGASTAAISSQRILRGSAAYTGTVEGDLWNDFTQHCLTGYIAGVKQFDSRTLFVQTADAVVTNTNAETTMFGAGVGTLTLPANFFVVGKTLAITLFGVHTMDATPPAITFRVKLGGVTFASVAYTDLNDTNQYFEIRFHLTCRTTGAGGTGIGQGYVLMHESTGASNTDMEHMVMTATAAMNTTGALALDVTAQPNAADAGSSLTITNALVEIKA